MAVFFDIIDLRTGCSYCRLRDEPFSIWPVIREVTAQHFDCDEDDVSLIETDDGDRIAIDDEPVAFTQDLPVRGRSDLHSIGLDPDRIREDRDERRRLDREDAA